MGIDQPIYQLFAISLLSTSRENDTNMVSLKSLTVRRDPTAPRWTTGELRRIESVANAQFSEMWMLAAGLRRPNPRAQTQESGRFTMFGVG